MCCRYLLVVAISLSFASVALAEDWPQWRGPERNGISKETGLAKEWPKEGPKLLWQVKDIGDGYSTPAVVGDRLFVISNRGMDKEFVQALSVHDGKEIWTTTIGKVGPNQGPQYPGTRSTPTVDGELLYALGSDGDLVCLDVKSGKERWHKSLRTDFEGKPGKWAYAESPLIDGDVLVCAPGGSKATIIALNKKNGEPIWQSALKDADDAAYASAIVVEVEGVKQYVEFLAKGLVGVDARTGNPLWRYGKTAQGSPANIATPLAHESYVYSAAGRSGGGLVKLKTAGSTIEVEQIYFTPKLPTAIGGTVLVEEHLYGTNGQGLLCRPQDRRLEMAGARSGSRGRLLCRWPPVCAWGKRRSRAGPSHTGCLSRERAVHPTGCAPEGAWEGLGLSRGR